MTRIAIITTTINVMPNLPAWAEWMSKDDVMVIAGDLKTPHQELQTLVSAVRATTGANIRYLHPDGQNINWSTGFVTPWNCIQRRNIAMLAALTYEPEVILTIDDDNFPDVFNPDLVEDDWLTKVHSIVTGSTGEFLYTDTGWWNPGTRCNPIVTHRGFPLEQRHERPTAMRNAYKRRPIGVFAALWLGDPDIDAIERIHAAPEVHAVDFPNVTLDLGTWAPFNSQATAYRAGLAPLMMCAPGIGRMDDIWASYVARTVMDFLGYHVQYGHPVVRQFRNEHDLVRDLEGELIGYRHTGDLCDHLRSLLLPQEETNVVNLLERVVWELETLPYVPDMVTDVYAAWIADLRALQANNEWIENAFTIEMKDEDQ